MKKYIVLALCVLVFASVAMAQVTFTKGSGAASTGPIDRLGAHQNGGRGCVGCHAPHSGAAGNGGNLNAVADANGNYAVENGTGEEYLWGQDLGPIYAKSSGFTFAGGENVVITATSEHELRVGVGMCLSCHDGNVAKGGMMENKSYEQAQGMLSGYGPVPIPTLLDADGTGKGYLNDHPVGEGAKLSSLRGLTAAATGYAGTPYLMVGTCGSGSSAYSCVTVADANSDYGKFVAAYGMMNISGTRSGTGVVLPVVDVGGVPTPDMGNAYLTCTTCHTPHSMIIFSGKAAGVSGKYPSYFFIAAPYNPMAKPAKNEASSATQFCRQCHFLGAGGSNEGNGMYNVVTKF